MKASGSDPADESAAPRPAKFSLAANYDPELVPALAAYPVDEVYGRFPTDGVSSGRPRYLATPLSEADLRRYIHLLDHHGIAFNYLLNGACFGNREWTRPWQRRVMALLTKLGDLGVRRVTVSTPFLLELVKRRFPEFKVRVGIYAQVDTPRRARFWEELGADAITLESFSINRNFARLAAIRQSVRCDLQLIANHVCLVNCPLQTYHQNGFAHASDNTSTLFKFGRTTAVAAARRALAEAGVETAEIAGLIVNTCTGYLCPGLSSYIAEDLGLKTSIRFLDLMGMGCGAAIPNLEAAAGMLARSGEGPVLSLAVEICTATIFPSHEPELVVSNSIFGDGAAAAVLDLSREGRPGGLAQMVDFATGLFPQYREDLRYRTEGGRLRNHLTKRVPVIGARTVTEVASRLLVRHRLSRNDIAW